MGRGDYKEIVQDLEWLTNFQDQENEGEESWQAAQKVSVVIGKDE
jgi:hypothetical protein